MSYRVGRIAVVGLLAGLWGCSDGPIAPPPGGGAELRLLHATPNLGAVSVELDGTTVINGVVYGMSSPIVDVSSGRHTLVVKSGSAVVGQLEYTLSESQINSLVVAGGTPQFASSVTPDTGAANPARANVRMVNVVGPTLADPTVLDVKVKAPNANPDSVLTFGLDAKIASYGTLMYFDAGHFEFRYQPQGEATVLTQVAFDVAVGEKKAVVLERDADGTYHATVVLEQ